MINLYTSFYQDKDLKRQKELLFCLNQNIKNPLIDKIYLIIEGEVIVPESDKIVLIPFKRPTYRDFFELIGRRVQSSDEISIICNTDIKIGQYI